MFRGFQIIKKGGNEGEHDVFEKVEIISPQIVLLLSRRPFFRLLRRQLLKLSFRSAGTTTTSQQNNQLTQLLHSIVGGQTSNESPVPSGTGQVQPTPSKPDSQLVPGGTVPKTSGKTLVHPSLHVWMKQFMLCGSKQVRCRNIGNSRLVRSFVHFDNSNKWFLGCLL